jgi:cytochrome c-type biogenesis protein CcmE
LKLGFIFTGSEILKKRYWIGGGVIVIAVAYLLYLSFGSSVSYYLTVSEFYDRSSELVDTNIRLAGIVADAPIEWEDMPVIYHGAQPSGFTEGTSILAEGKYSADGIFRASQLILKCPSKYESIEME